MKQQGRSSICAIICGADSWVGIEEYGNSKLKWFKEDDSRIRSGYAAESVTLIRHIASNLLGRENSVKVGKRAKRLKA